MFSTVFLSVQPAKPSQRPQPRRSAVHSLVGLMGASSLAVTGLVLPDGSQRRSRSQ
jgi:hypothetical protein